MQFISLQENLKKGLQVVGHTTSKNVNLPILNNVLIKAYSGEIEFISTNLEIGVNCKIRGKVEKEGEYTVNSRILTDYINLLKSNEKVLVKLEENDLIVECGDYKTKIKGEESKEFPLIPSIESDVIFSVSNSENRLELTGVLFSFSNNKLELVATDSYRLAENIINIEKSEADFKIIIPAKTIQEVLRILNNNSEEENNSKINISFSDNQVLFSFNSTSLISRLINGNYPDYKQIIPTNEKTTAIIDKSELLRAVKAASLFSKNGINDILLQFKKGQLTVSSFSSASGESKIKIKAVVKGEENNEITINYRYLIDGLNNIEAQEIEMLIINDNSPCLIRSKDSKDYLYIVMPIRQ